MRNRILKPGFFANYELACLPALTRILFQGLWALADKNGRLHDRPPQIKAEVLPYDTCDVEEMLQSLAAGGFIRRYAVGSGNYILVCKFAQHQTLTDWEKNKTIAEIPPPPDEGNYSITAEVLQKTDSRTSRLNVRDMSRGEVSAPAREKSHQPVGANTGKQTGRERIKTLLATLLLAATDDAFEREWRPLLEHEAGVKSADEALAFLEWGTDTAREQGREVRYARHLIPQAHYWRKNQGITYQRKESA